MSRPHSRSSLAIQSSVSSSPDGRTCSRKRRINSCGASVTVLPPLVRKQTPCSSINHGAAVRQRNRVDESLNQTARSSDAGVEHVRTRSTGAASLPIRRPASAVSAGTGHSDAVELVQPVGARRHASGHALSLGISVLTKHGHSCQHSTD